MDLSKLDDRNKHISCEQITALKDRLGIPNDQKVILVGARFEPVKDHFFTRRDQEGQRTAQIRFCLPFGRRRTVERANSAASPTPRSF